MDARKIADYALGKPGAWPDQPWEEDRVAKVGPSDKGKIFAFLGDTTLGIKAGANREEADEWLQRYPDDAKVMAYIGKSGWNTLTVGGAIPLDELLEAIDDSYQLVVSKMPKYQRPDGWDS
jgi:predicted DNA-binding protein (MmcQ/YjbR family)